MERREGHTRAEGREEWGSNGYMVEVSLCVSDKGGRRREGGREREVDIYDERACVLCDRERMEYVCEKVCI